MLEKNYWQRNPFKSLALEFVGFASLKNKCWSDSKSISVLQKCQKTPERGGIPKKRSTTYYVAHICDCDVLPNVSHILKLMKEQCVQKQEQNFAVLVAAHLTQQQQKD